MSMKKTIFRLFFLFTILSTLWCCRNEEFSTEDSAQQDSYSSSTRFASKSFWKEDEVYIHKVLQVFMKVANAEHVKSRYGELYWDYAMTFGQFGEKYLLVPVVKDNRVILLMEAVREGNKVYFFEKDDKKMIDFFHAIIFSNITDYGEKTEPQTGISSRNTPTFVCSTRWITIGCTNNEPNCTPYTTSETICKWTPGTNPKTFDPIGMDDGGGGGDGYEYPDPPETEDPCTKLKAQNINANFKVKVDLLATKVGLKKETGYAESKSGVFTELSPAVSTASSDGMTVTVTPDLKGYIHTHLNDYETGKTNENGEIEINQPIRMFSPADVNTLMTMAGMVTDDNYSELYGAMVSSYGNYTIMFTGAPTDIKTGFDTQRWRDEYAAFRTRNPYWSFEKLFLNFLRYNMDVQGVELYKIKSNGTVQKKTLNSNNNVQSNDCP
ncbi:hypothetical protein A1704_02655 [Chryseobacterium cucumeris]|nr:hypothetical protein A1704_02655 [Chryseobacterium cucumeris]